MNWIRYVFTFAFLCTLTGTCFSIIWFLLRGVLERYDSRVIYHCLKIVMLFYILPVTFIGMLIRQDVGYYTPSIIVFYDSLVFDLTPTILKFMKTTMLIWFIGIVIFLCLQIKDAWKWHNIRLGNIPEDDMEVQKLFERVCEKMQVGNKVALARNDLLVIPVLSGLFHPTVILPCIDYTMEELEVIFTHELVHYKHGDLWVKLAAVIITAVHCLNPAAHLLLYSVNVWSEVNCDIAACELLENTYSAKEYYVMIVNRMIRNQKMERYLLSAMAENSNEMSRRIKQMKYYQKRKGLSGKRAAAFVTAFTVAGLGLSLVFGGLTAEAHQKLYDAVKVENNLELPQTENTVVTKEVKEAVSVLRTASTEGLQRDTLEPGTKVEEIPIEWNPKARNMQWDIHWYIDREKVLKSALLKLNAGDKVHVLMGFTPDNLYMKFGLVYPDGSMWFTGDRGFISYTFDIPETGDYRVYMHNKSKDYYIEATGTVIFETENYQPEDGGSVSGQL